MQVELRVRDGIAELVVFDSPTSSVVIPVTWRQLLTLAGRIIQEARNVGKFRE